MALSATGWFLKELAPVRSSYADFFLPFIHASVYLACGKVPTEALLDPLVQWAGLGG